MIGNSQDLSVLSNIDLRIAGKLTDHMKIQAVISDNNLPFQEDGSTYKLQEFDKVYVRIYNDMNELIAGDIELRYLDRYLKYQKKTQGISFSLKKKFKDFILKSNSSASMSKGKYATNSFFGREGDQGPYKLMGNNEEPYIVTLSGTERVFIDGLKQIRGIDNDYIIDYNTSEIIFTNKNFITKDKRIYVEFEYDDRSYPQSLITSHQHFENNTMSFSIDVFSETDWKNQHYTNELSEMHKKTLSNNGDNGNNILANSIDSVSFSSDRILYKKMDTIIEDSNIIYYEFSTNPDSAVYQIRFSKVGPNEGNYILDKEEVNGKIYKWVPPMLENNQLIPQGDYTPKIRIISPKSKTIISSSIKYKLSEKFIMNTNIALDYTDQNLFSDLDDSDNTSFAGFASFEYEILKTEKWKLKSINSIEYISERFKGANRFQEVEFNRLWNINSINKSHLLNSNSLHLFWKGSEIIRYDLQNLRKDTSYSGIKNRLYLNLKSNKFTMSSETDYSYIQSDDYNSMLLRSNNNMTREFTYFNLSMILKGESILNYSDASKLQENSQSFIHSSSKLKHRDNLFSLELINRKDKVPNGLVMQELSNANEVNAEISLIKNQNINYNTRMLYRKLHYYTKNVSDEISLLNSNTLSSNLLNKFLQLHINYELGKGKEAKKEKHFIKVPVGMGTHNWIDNNNNGIQELNEFVIALFQDEGEYVSLYLPSTQLENIYSLNYSQNITADIKQISNHQFFKKLHFSTSFQLNNKNKINDLIYNPFTNKYKDSSINYMSQNMNTLSYNRTHRKFNLQLINKNSFNKNSFSYGSDDQKIHENTIVGNLLLYNTVKSLSKITVGKKENSSNFFNDKNFEYTYNNLEQNIILKKGANIELTIRYMHKQKHLSYTDSESNSSNNELSNAMYADEISLLYQQTENEKNIIDIEGKIINIRFNSTYSSIINYEIMEGLSNGKNLVWGMKYKKKLRNNMVMDLSYSGRKSKNSDVKHIGNIGLQAYF